MATKNKKNIILPSDVAKYFLIRAEKDGELISPLKMQKLVYFAYALYLVSNKGKKKLFQERIQAWPAGPVVPSLYGELKKYGSTPINAQKYVDISEEKFKKKYPKQILFVLDRVYEVCERFTPFELMVISHNEKAWLKARDGLAPYEKTNNVLEDKDILEQHLKK